MLSFLRPELPPRTRTAHHENPVYEDGRAKVEFNPPGSDFDMTHTVPPTTTAHGVSLANPPLHFHTFQEEIFRVEKGAALFYIGVDKKPSATVNAGHPPIRVPAGRYHRFENASPVEDLVLHERKDPNDAETDQRFFRNAFGYLDDCKRAGVQPSVFQLVVFAHAASTPLALPAPFRIESLGYWMSRLVTTALAFVGMLLGYQQSYAEYYQERKAL